VPYKNDEKEINLTELYQKLKDIYEENDIKVKIIIEPGRFLVAEAGIILTKVTQIKDKNEEIKYIGLDCGMNNLIRFYNYVKYI
jgi:diaminopimelate decarboxylase